MILKKSVELNKKTQKRNLESVTKLFFSKEVISRKNLKTLLLTTKLKILQWAPSKCKIITVFLIDTYTIFSRMPYYSWLYATNILFPEIWRTRLSTNLFLLFSKSKNFSITVFYNKHTFPKIIFLPINIV